MLSAQLAACSDVTVLQTSTPISKEEFAAKRLGIPLPSSASSIEFYRKTGGLQQLDFYLRFQVAPEEADAAVERIIDDNNRMMKRSLSYPKTEISVTSVPKVPLPNGASADGVPGWWRSQQIVRGFVRGEDVSYAPTIWYDADRSIIFLRQGD